MKQNDKDRVNTAGAVEDSTKPKLPMYDAESVQKPGPGSHQMTTGDATRVEDANDTRVKNDSGPEHFAPPNPNFSSSFDEFAGDFAGETPVLLADRDGSDYARHEQAYDFGHRSALEDRFAAREWPEAETDLKAEWAAKGHGSWDQWWPSVQMGWTRARGLG